MKPQKSQHSIVKYAFILLALTGVQGKEKVTFYEYDALGSIVAATDEQGEILWKEHYDPYGNRLVRDQASGDNRIWYTGHQETDFGLIYMGARHYDPATGWFLSVDPLGFREGDIQSFNRYAYVNNNPYRYWDPDGRDKLDYPRAGANVAAGSMEMIFCSVCYASGMLGGPATPRLEYEDQTDGQIGEFLANSAGPGGVFKGGFRFAITRTFLRKGERELGGFAQNYAKSVGPMQCLPKVLQTGGNKFNKSMAKGLNEQLGENLTKRDWGDLLKA